MAIGVAAVEFGGVIARYVQLLLVFVVPAEGGDVAVVAEHDACLTGRGLGGDAAVDVGELVIFLFYHAFERWHVAVGNCFFDVVKAEAVDFHHDQAALTLIDVGI